MRRIVIMMALMLIALTPYAQEQESSSLNERFYQAKLRELVHRLDITSEQQKKFRPIYRNYCEEMTALWAERKKPITSTTSSGKAAAIEKRKMEMQQRAQGIRMKYIDRLATVLNAEQINHFFEVESDIQNKLRERKEQARNRQQ